MLRDNFAKLTKYAREPQRQRLARRKLDGPPNQAAQLSAGMHFHDAVTGIFSAAVNTQDAHVSAVYRGDASEPSRRVNANWETSRPQILILMNGMPEAVHRGKLDSKLGSHCMHSLVEPPILAARSDRRRDLQSR